MRPAARGLSETACLRSAGLPCPTQTARYPRSRGKFRDATTFPLPVRKHSAICPHEAARQNHSPAKSARAEGKRQPAFPHARRKTGITTARSKPLADGTSAEYAFQRVQHTAQARFPGMAGQHPLSSCLHDFSAGLGMIQPPADKLRNFAGITIADYFLARLE